MYFQLARAREVEAGRQPLAGGPAHDNRCWAGLAGIRRRMSARPALQPSEPAGGDITAAFKLVIARGLQAALKKAAAASAEILKPPASGPQHRHEGPPRMR